MPNHINGSNWVALPKEALAWMPHTKNTAYTKLEALFSLTIDLNTSLEKGEREYSRIWGWSKTTTREFLAKMKDPKRTLRALISEEETEQKDFRPPSDHKATTRRPQL